LDWAPPESGNNDTVYHISSLASGEPFWKIDGGSAQDTQFLNPIIEVGDTVGFYLTQALDTVIFRAVPTNVDTSDTNELQNLTIDSLSGSGIEVFTIGLSPPGNTVKFSVPTSSGSGTILELTSSNVTSVTNPTTNTVFTTTLTANKWHRIELMGFYSSAATTTGIKLGFFYPTSTPMSGKVEVELNNGAATGLVIPMSNLESTVNNNVNVAATTSVTGSNTNYPIYTVIYVKPTTSESLTVGWASEVTGSNVTLVAGTVLNIQTY
jgi:hypothetical protein